MVLVVVEIGKGGHETKKQDDGYKEKMDKQITVKGW